MVSASRLIRRLMIGLVPIKIICRIIPVRNRISDVMLCHLAILMPCMGFQDMQVSPLITGRNQHTPPGRMAAVTGRIKADFFTAGFDQVGIGSWVNRLITAQFIDWLKNTTADQARCLLQGS